MCHKTQKGTFTGVDLSTEALMCNFFFFLEILYFWHILILTKKNIYVLWRMDISSKMKGKH